MTDLISRKALLEVLKKEGEGVMGSGYVKLLITNLPAVEQGEVADYQWRDLSRVSLNKWHSTDKKSFDDLSSEIKRGLDFEVRILYTTPPQPETVREALEKAIKIMDEKLTGRCWATDLDAAERVIRALIKEVE